MNENKDERSPSLPGITAGKAATELFAKVFDRTGNGVMSVLGDVFGGLVGDPIHEWRTRNSVRLAEKTANFIVKKTGNLDNLNHLPNGELYSLFEEASKYDEEELQNIWANLLATSLTEKEFVGRLRPLIAIARQMDAFDARTLKALFEYEKIHEKCNSVLSGSLANKLTEHKVEKEEFMLRLRAKEKVGLAEIDDELSRLAGSGATEEEILEKRKELESSLRNRIDPSRFEFERKQTSSFRSFSDEKILITQKEVDGKISELWQRYHDVEGMYEETSLHNLLRLGCILGSPAARFYPGVENETQLDSLVTFHLSELERLNDAKPPLGRLFSRFGQTRRTNFMLTNLGYRFASATCDVSI